MYSENNDLSPDLESSPEEKERLRLATQQRIKYGVAEIDTWSFDNYLLGVLYNGLKSLVDKGHSYSGESYEEWIQKLTTAADNAFWCWREYDRLVMELFDEYFGDAPDITDGIDKFLSYTIPEALHEEYITKDNALGLEKHDRKNELMDFLKENFFALWD